MAAGVKEERMPSPPRPGKILLQRWIFLEKAIRWLPLVPFDCTERGLQPPVPVEQELPEVLFGGCARAAKTRSGSKS